MNEELLERRERRSKRLLLLLFAFWVALFLFLFVCLSVYLFSLLKGGTVREREGYGGTGS